MMVLMSLHQVPALLDMFLDVVHESLNMFYTLPPDVFTSALNTVNSDSFSIQVRTSDNSADNEEIRSNEKLFASSPNS